MLRSRHVQTSVARGRPGPAAHLLRRGASRGGVAIGGVALLPAGRQHRAGHPVRRVDDDAQRPDRLDVDEGQHLVHEPRPDVVRRDTDQILSYYHSDLAGRPYDHDSDPRPALTRHDSHGSRSSSEYSAESLKEAATRPPQRTTATQPAHSQHTRRPSVPTQESADRRRLAIIEVDSELPPSVSRKGSVRGAGNNSGVSQSSLLSRRGLHVNGLALVAPPDASPATYTNLTPPPSAPAFPVDRQSYISPTPAAYTHTRSASEAVGKSSNLRRQTSRDVGIVGTSAIPRIIEMSVPSTPPRKKYQSLMGTGGLEEPIFQTPGKSRSPSPGAFTPDLSNSTTTHEESFFTSPTQEADDPALTPAIGEGKDIISILSKL